MVSPYQILDCWCPNGVLLSGAGPSAGGHTSVGWRPVVGRTPSIPQSRRRVCRGSLTLRVAHVRYFSWRFRHKHSSNRGWHSRPVEQDAHNSHRAAWRRWGRTSTQDIGCRLVPPSSASGTLRRYSTRFPQVGISTVPDVPSRLGRTSVAGTGHLPLFFQAPRVTFLGVF